LERPPTGNKLDLPLVCIFDFEGDELVNEKVFFDFAAVQRQADRLHDAGPEDGHLPLDVRGRDADAHESRRSLRASLGGVDGADMDEEEVSVES
jgi:hypothetical protein